MKKLKALFISLCFVMSLAIVTMAMPNESTGSDGNIASNSNANYAENIDLASPSSATMVEFDIFLPLKDTDDYAEIQALTDEMLEIANNLYDTGELKQKMRTSDIDFDRAVKIYMDRESSLIGLDSSDVDELSSYLKTAEYIWEVPVDVGSQTVTFTLNIGKGVNPETEDLLTEEQKNFINSKIDKWFIVRTSWGIQRGVDYKQYVKNQITQNSLSNESTFVLIGGIPEVNYPIAIEINKNQLEAVVPSSVETERSMKQILKVADERSMLSTADYVTFEQLKQSITEMN